MTGNKHASQQIYLSHIRAEHSNGIVRINVNYKYAENFNTKNIALRRKNITPNRPQTPLSQTLHNRFKFLYSIHDLCDAC